MASNNVTVATGMGLADVAALNDDDNTSSISLEESLANRNHELEQSRAECLRLKEEIKRLKQQLESFNVLPKPAIDSKKYVRCKGYLGCALMKALETRSSARIIELLNRKADVNYRDGNGLPALSYAAMFGCPPAVVKLMLERGADVDIADNYGMTPLFRSIENDAVSIVQLFLDYGADANFSGLHCNKTPLMLAAERGQTNFVKMLLERNANVDFQSIHGWTALIYAAQTNRLEAAELLVDAGANVNVRTTSTQIYRGVTSPSNRGIRVYKDTTPLMIAVERNNLDFILLLLSSGATVEGANENGDTALSLASKDETKLALREAIHSSSSS